MAIYRKNPSAYHNFLSKGAKEKTEKEKKDDAHNKVVARLAAERLEASGGDKRKAIASGKAYLSSKRKGQGGEGYVYGKMKGLVPGIVGKGTEIAFKEIERIKGPLLQRLNDIGNSGVADIKGRAERKLREWLKRKSANSVVENPRGGMESLGLQRFSDYSSPEYLAIVEQQSGKLEAARAIEDPEEREKAAKKVAAETQELMDKELPGKKGRLSEDWRERFAVECENVFAGLFLYGLERMPQDKVSEHKASAPVPTAAPTLEALVKGDAFSWLKKASPPPGESAEDVEAKRREEELSVAREKQQEIRGQLEEKRRKEEEVEAFRKEGGKVPPSVLEALVEKWGGKLG